MTRPVEASAQTGTSLSSDVSPNTNGLVGGTVPAELPGCLLLEYPPLDSISAQLANRREWPENKFSVSLDNVISLIGAGRSDREKYLSSTILDVILRLGTSTESQQTLYRAPSGRIIVFPEPFGHWVTLEARGMLTDNDFSRILNGRRVALPEDWQELCFLVNIRNVHWIVLTFCRSQRVCQVADSLAVDRAVAILDESLRPTYLLLQAYLTRLIGGAGDWQLVAEPVPRQHNLLTVEFTPPSMRSASLSSCMTETLAARSGNG